MLLFEYEQDVNALIEAKKAGKHLCLNGRYVDCQSEKCRDDLRRRIDDAVHTRNYSNNRSDERSYYNGILRVLRRKFREVEKHLNQQLTETSVVNSVSFKARREVTINQRILKLSGLL
jgi:hypothetical protein